MYQKLLRKKLLSARLNQEESSVDQTMVDILDKFDQLKKAKHATIPFTDFYEVATRAHIVTTFLAMLELVREKKIYFIQDVTYGDILLKRLWEEADEDE